MESKRLRLTIDMTGSQWCYLLRPGPAPPDRRCDCAGAGAAHMPTSVELLKHACNLSTLAAGTVSWKPSDRLH